MIWIARERVGVVINVRLILRLRWNVLKIMWNSLTWMVLRRVTTMYTHRCKLLNAHIELFIELMTLLIRISRWQVEALYRASMKRRLTILKVVVAALPVNAMTVGVWWNLKLWNEAKLEVMSSVLAHWLTSTWLYPFIGSTVTDPSGWTTIGGVGMPCILSCVCMCIRYSSVTTPRLLMNKLTALCVGWTFNVSPVD